MQGTVADIYIYIYINAKDTQIHTGAHRNMARQSDTHTLVQQNISATVPCTMWCGPKVGPLNLSLKFKLARISNTSCEAAH